MTEMPKTFEFADIATVNTIPFLRGPNDTAPKTIDMPFPKEVARLINDRTIYYYIWGEASYRDILNDNIIHKTEYCYRLLFFDEKNVTYTIYEAGHNCAAEECKKRTSQ